MLLVFHFRVEQPLYVNDLDHDFSLFSADVPRF